MEESHLLKILYWVKKYAHSYFTNVKHKAVTSEADRQTGDETVRCSGSAPVDGEVLLCDVHGQCFRPVAEGLRGLFSLVSELFLLLVPVDSSVPLQPYTWGPVHITLTGLPHSPVRQEPLLQMDKAERS